MDRRLACVAGALALGGVAAYYLLRRPSPPEGARLPPCGNYGDVDGDGYVRPGVDSELVFAYLTGGWDAVREKAGELGVELRTDEAEFARRADVTGDGLLSIRDPQLIEKYARGLADTFPVCGEQQPPSEEHETVELLPDADCYVSYLRPDEGFGDAPELWVGRRFVAGERYYTDDYDLMFAFLRFDLSEVEIDAVERAELLLYCTKATTDGAGVALPMCVYLEALDRADFPEDATYRWAHENMPSWAAGTNYRTADFGLGLVTAVRDRWHTLDIGDDFERLLHGDVLAFGLSAWYDCVYFDGWYFCFPDVSCPGTPCSRLYEYWLAFGSRESGNPPKLRLTLRR